MLDIIGTTTFLGRSVCFVITGYIITTFVAMHEWRLAIGLEMYFSSEGHLRIFRSRIGLSSGSSPFCILDDQMDVR